MDSTGLEEFKLLHESHRAIYSILVTGFWRDPSECLLIMGLWLWLECVGFNHFMSKIFSVYEFLMNELADEAVVCLKCMKDGQFLFSAIGSEIPLTRSLVEKDISLQFFCDYRHIALPEIERLATEVYAPWVADIKAFHEDNGESSSQNHRMISGNAAQIIPGSQMMTSSFFDYSLMLSRPQLRIGGDVSHHRSQVNEVPQEERRTMLVPFSRGSLVSERELRGRTRVHEVSREDRRAIVPFLRCHPAAENQVRGRTRVHEVPQEERAMFITFSRGYPVAETEVRQFITRIYGNCLESIHMQLVMPGEQSLYAIAVFLRPSFIDAILNGTIKAKFTVNGKHVWMRKFVAQRRSSS